MSKLPPFDPQDQSQAPPAIPAIPAIRTGGNSENSDNSSSLPVGEGYQSKHGKEPEATDAELSEMEEQVRKKGYVLLWSNVLEDFVAFYRAAADLDKIPDLFVAYSESEIRKLFGDEESGPTRSGLRLIHEVKKLGGKIVSSQIPGGESA